MNATAAGKAFCIAFLLGAATMTLGAAAGPSSRRAGEPDSLSAPARFEGAPLWPEQTGDWVPARAACLFSIYGEKLSARAPGLKTDDKWLTLEIRFPRPAPRAFGHLSGGDLVALADSGALALRTGIPPGVTLAWAFSPDDGGTNAPVVPSVMLFDRGAAVPPELSVRPQTDRVFYGRLMLYFDLDGDGLAEFPVHVETERPSGFLPKICAME